MKKFFTIAKKEFIKNVKRPSFWILTFWIPIIYIIVFWVILFSNSQTNDVLKERNDSIKNIFIFDESWIIKENSSDKNIVLVKDYNSWYEKFLEKKENIFLHYKKDFLETKNIDLFVNSKDFLDSYEWIVNDITKNSIFEDINQKELVKLYTSNFHTNIKKFEKWKEISDLSNKNIVAWVWAFVFFFMIIFGTTIMLTSTSQEKENRVVEIILSTVDTLSFVLWKIFWWLLVILFQLLVFLILPILSLIFFREYIPWDILQVFSKVSFIDWIFMLFYIISWFLIFAWIMVSVWSLWANSKQAWQMSTPFTLMSIIPLYLTSALMVNPTWFLALFLSYFPFTSSMVLLYRTGAWELLPFENIIWPLVTLIFIFISLFIAKKSFEYWVLEYKDFSFKKLFSKK